AHSDVRRPSVARSGHGGGLGPSERDSRNFGAALGPSPAPTLSVILFDRGDCQMSTWTEDDKQIAARALKTLEQARVASRGAAIIALRLCGAKWRVSALTTRDLLKEGQNIEKLAGRRKAS